MLLMRGLVRFGLLSGMWGLPLDLSLGLAFGLACGLACGPEPR